MLMSVIFRLMYVSALLAACIACAGLSVQGEFFGRRLDALEPKHTILIIFNHGYSSEKATTFKPEFPLILRMAVEQNTDVALFAQVRNTASLQSTDHRQFIEAAVEFFHNSHKIPIENMILSGQSCGGWGSLEAVALTYPRMGGVIVFAPTCHGRLYQQSLWRETQRHQEIGEFAQLLRSPALIFLYEGDSYYKLADWKAFEARAEAFPQIRVVKLDKGAVLKVCPRCDRDSHGAANAPGFANTFFATHVQTFIESVRASIREREGRN